MTSLVFRALDHHVVHGAADRLAVDAGPAQLTYAQLLAQTAAFAGGLVQVGVREGTPVAILIDGIDEIVAVLACARIGAIPSEEADFRIDGSPAVVHTSEHDYPWATVLSAGKTDPIPSPEADPDGYVELLAGSYEDLFAALLEGETYRTPQA